MAFVIREKYHFFSTYACLVKTKILYIGRCLFRDYSASPKKTGIVQKLFYLDLANAEYDQSATMHGFCSLSRLVYWVTGVPNCFIMM